MSGATAVLVASTATAVAGSSGRAFEGRARLVPVCRVSSAGILRSRAIVHGAERKKTQQRLGAAEIRIKFRGPG